MTCHSKKKRSRGVSRWVFCTYYKFIFYLSFGIIEFWFRKSSEDGEGEEETFGIGSWSLPWGVVLVQGGCFVEIQWTPSHSSRHGCIRHPSKAGTRPQFNFRIFWAINVLSRVFANRGACNPCGSQLWWGMHICSYGNVPYQDCCCGICCRLDAFSWPKLFHSPPRGKYLLTPQLQYMCVYKTSIITWDYRWLVFSRIYNCCT